MAQTQARQLTQDRPAADPAPHTPIAAVLHTGGVQFASEKAAVERALCAQPGVVSADCNPVAQTTTVAFDPSRTSIAELRSCVEVCG